MRARQEISKYISMLYWTVCKIYAVKNCLSFTTLEYNYYMYSTNRLKHTVNTHLSAAICFQRIWWVDKFGRLTGYSLVLVHYIGTGKLWLIKRFGGLTRIHCTSRH